MSHLKNTDSASLVLCCVHCYGSIAVEVAAVSLKSLHICLFFLYVSYFHTFPKGWMIINHSHFIY